MSTSYGQPSPAAKAAAIAAVVHGVLVRDTVLPAELLEHLHDLMCSELAQEPGDLLSTYLEQLGIPPGDCL